MVNCWFTRCRLRFRCESFIYFFLNFVPVRYDLTNKKNVELNLLDTVGLFRDFVGRCFRPGRAVSNFQHNYIIIIRALCGERCFSSRGFVRISPFDEPFANGLNFCENNSVLYGIRRHNNILLYCIYFARLWTVHKILHSYSMCWYKSVVPDDILSDHQIII